MAIANFNHVAIWVMEEELIHCDTAFLNHCGHIFNVHLLQFLDYHPHVRGLERNVVVFWVDRAFFLSRSTIGLKQMDANSIVEQPKEQELKFSSLNFSTLQMKNSF